MFLNEKPMMQKKQSIPFYRKSGMYFISLLLLFVSIGALTTVKPAYRFSSQLISNWTTDIDSSAFLYLMGMENRTFRSAYPENKSFPKLSNIFFQIAAHIKPNDPSSLLGREIPGLSAFGSKIIVAGEDTDYLSLAIESSPPLDEVLKERQAIFEEQEDSDSKESKQDQLSTGDRQVVFLYNSHNRESFLPHLPDVTDPRSAHHDEVNITKVSDRIASKLEANGIGANVDKTDHMSVLKQKGWKYGKSYEASREVVEAAVTTNKDIQYIFDIHRDSLPRDKTTKSINGEDYAQILTIIGEDHPNYEKNLAFATSFHYLLNEKYPGISRGVITKGGAKNNGIYNQDLSENALLFEMGGYDNTLNELYRSADALAEVFSEFYWDAEKVDANP